VTSISPTGGPLAGGTTITITGTGFVSGATVKIGVNSATGVVFGSATSLTVVTPSGTGAQSVVVTNPDTQSSNTNINFTYEAAPTISSFTPTTGVIGTSVTINGTNFIGANSVSFGGVAATSYNVNSGGTQITAVIGNRATGTISVVTPSGTATSSGIFTLTGSSGITTTGSTSYPTTNIGNTSTGTAGNLSNYIEADKYTTTVPFTAQAIHTYGTASGNVKVSIYSDSSGNPGSKLFTEVASAVTANTWSNITIPNTYLAPGTYWIVFNCDTANAVTHSTGVTGSTRYYKSLTYATAFPSPGGSGWTAGASQTEDCTYISGVQIEGYAKATQVTLSAGNVSINSVSFYSAAAGNVSLAIYSNVSSAPSALLWQSSSTACTASAWNTINISTGTPTNLSLNSGTYWLVWEWNSPNSGPSYSAGSTGTGNYIVATYGSFPTSWPSGISTSENWSIYVSYTIN
jgi:hypothetical protein